MLDFITSQRLTPADFNTSIEFLIENLVAKNLITLLYAEGGSGKSWLAYAIAKHAAQQSMSVLYLDYDNPISVLAERNLDNILIEPNPNLYYISSSKADISAINMIDKLLQNQSDHLDNTLIILDSLRDFVDVRNDNQVLFFMSKLKRLREAGATVVALSHSNKDGNNYEGSNNLYNSLDNLYQVKKLDNPDSEIKYLITPRKDRASSGESAWSLNTQDLSLTELDINQAKLSDEDKDFIEQIQKVLRQTPGLNKKELLDAIGKDKRDKTANARLERYKDRHWVCVKKRNVYTFQLKSAEQSPKS